MTKEEWIEDELKKADLDGLCKETILYKLLEKQLSENYDLQQEMGYAISRWNPEAFVLSEN